MNGNRARWVLVGALCVAIWTDETLAQTEYPAEDNPCPAPIVRTDVRPNSNGPPTEVSVGIHMFDLTEINDVAQSLTGDFVVVTSWKDARLSNLQGCAISLEDVWSPGLAFTNSGRLFTSRPREVTIGPGSQVKFIQRYYGALASYHNLRYFPFDSHKIVISLLPVNWPEQDVKLIVDEKVTGRRELLNISDWTIENVRGSIGRVDSDAFGGFHSRYDFQITASRITNYYIWKVILPLCLIVAMSWCVFWINPAQFGPQIGLSATSMLTLIAFIFATTNMVPKLGYFTSLDIFIGASTILVFLALLQSLTTSYLVSKEKLALAERTDRICRIAFPLAFLALMLALLQR